MNRIGIIGGGMMGLTLATKLSHQGHQVTIFERNGQLGGLATYHDYGTFFWDRFYHVILPCDTPLINFIHEIGLSSKLRWHKSLTGFYVNETLYSLSNSLEFLRFPALSLIQKLRLALTILYCARIKNWQKLEKVNVETWLSKTCGQKTFEILWKPLLLAKLGQHYERVSAVFIWTYIKRLFAAKESSAKKEQLGHVEGGYKTIIDRLESQILEADGTIKIGVEVETITPGHRGGILVGYDGRQEHFDKVIFTSPVNVLQQTASTRLVDIKQNGSTVEYLGVVCVVLVTEKPLVPYYLVNIADSEVPFTGIIGMTNVVSPCETGNKHLTYLPKYVLSDDGFLHKSDAEICELFFKALRKILPAFKEHQVTSVHVNRAAKVQPLQVLNYSTFIPSVRTKHEDFFVLNTTQFINDTLNNNSVVRHVEEFLTRHGHLLADTSILPKPQLATSYSG